LRDSREISAEEETLFIFTDVYDRPKNLEKGGPFAYLLLFHLLSSP